MLRNKQIPQVYLFYKLKSEYKAKVVGMFERYVLVTIYCFIVMISTRLTMTYVYFQKIKFSSLKEAAFFWEFTVYSVNVDHIR